MQPYCLKCRKNRENKNRKIVRTKNARIMLLTKFAWCDCQKLKFLKDEEAKVLLGNLLGAKISILGDIF